MPTRANAARAAINESLEAGKSFDEAVKAAEVEAESLPVFSINQMPEDLENASSIAVAVGEMGEKDLSQVIEAPGGEGYMLVYVDKIELYEDEEAENIKRGIASSMEAGLRYRMFNSLGSISGKRNPVSAAPAQFARPPKRERKKVERQHPGYIR